MDPEQFQSRLQQCQAMPGENDPLYRSAMNELVAAAGGAITMGEDADTDRKLGTAVREDGPRPWSEIGPSPLDQRFAGFSALYLEADPQQRQALRERFDGEDLRKLNVFMGRAARLIRSAEDTQWFRLGLAAAGIEARRYDFRDFYGYLDILRSSAERVGIETRPIIEEAIEMSPHIEEDLRRLRDKSRRSLNFSVRTMGPPDWAEEAKVWWKFW